MKKHLLFILSISVIVLGSCKKSESPHSLEGKWFISNGKFVPMLNDGTPHPTMEEVYEDLDDPNFEFIGSRSDYYIEFQSNGTYKFGPDVKGTYSIEGSTVNTTTPESDITYSYSISGETLILKGVRYYTDWKADITYKLRRSL